jgi:hypothetical protein
LVMRMGCGCQSACYNFGVHGKNKGWVFLPSLSVQRTLYLKPVIFVKPCISVPLIDLNFSSNTTRLADQQSRRRLKVNILAMTKKFNSQMTYLIDK